VQNNPVRICFAEFSKICDLYWGNERWLGEAIEWTKHHGMVIDKELFTSTKTAEAGVNLNRGASANVLR